MALYIDGVVDPVAALGKRELDFLPKHFHCVSLSNYFYDLRPYRNWIWTNHSGRFYLGPKIKWENARLTNENIAAFEDAGEAIMFSFVLPNIKSDSDIFEDI